ncbi:hypothetical protein [Ruegeria atlantica]|uniref:hypothetical protein n=1 Tax=Ruegeria atlantica TaxID=81569 RepID=UPI00147A56F6|nr:hypothetical protein [Ruegeria atlantica]
MKKLITLSLALGLPAAAQATDTGPLDGADFVVTCTSEQSGETVTLARSGASDAGFIDAGEIRGEVKILPGIDSLTFLHIMGRDVVTFVVDFQDLSYDMTIKGAHATNDRGSCDEPII